MKKSVVFLLLILSLIMTPSMAFAFSEHVAITHVEIPVEPHVSVPVEESHVASPVPVESEENVRTTPVVPVVPHTATTQSSATNQNAAVQATNKKGNDEINYVLIGMIAVLSIALMIAAIVSVKGRK